MSINAKPTNRNVDRVGVKLTVHKRFEAMQPPVPIDGDLVMAALVFWEHADCPPPSREVFGHGTGRSRGVKIDRELMTSVKNAVPDQDFFALQRGIDNALWFSADRAEEEGRDVREVLQVRLPQLGEGKDGFRPPF